MPSVVARIAILVLSSLTLPAGISAAREADLARIRTIGIVAAMGDELELANVGTTAFGNSRGTVDVAAWKLDDDVAARISALLKGRYETIALRDFDKTRFRPKGPGFFGAQIDEEDETKLVAARAGAAAAGIDAYLLVYPLFNVNPMSYNNQWLTGPGLYRESSFGRAREAIYALGVMTIVDARTFDEIGTKWLSLKSGDRETGNDLPFRRVEGVVAESYDAMTPEQKRQAETIMKEVLRDAVEHTLRRLKLLQP